MHACIKYVQYVCTCNILIFYSEFICSLTVKVNSTHSLLCSVKRWTGSINYSKSLKYVIMKAAILSNIIIASWSLQSSLLDIQKAIKGLVVMSEELERVYTSFLNNQVF